MGLGYDGYSKAPGHFSTHCFPVEVPKGEVANLPVEEGSLLIFLLLAIVMPLTFPRGLQVRGF